MTRERAVEVGSFTSAEDAGRVLAALTLHKIKGKVEEVVLRALVRPPDSKPHCIHLRRWAIFVAAEVSAQARRVIKDRLSS